jgi:hypothetical protein
VFHPPIETTRVIGNWPTPDRRAKFVVYGSETKFRRSHLNRSDLDKISSEAGMLRILLRHSCFDGTRGMTQFAWQVVKFTAGSSLHSGRTAD